jgi:predicted DNA-binding transcriptional regulator AlpA
MTSLTPLALLQETAAGSPLARVLFSPRETEAILGVSHATLYRLIAAGRLDARKLESKTVITAESINRLIAELPAMRRQP